MKRPQPDNVWDLLVICLVLLFFSVLALSCIGCTSAPRSIQTREPYTSVVISESMWPLLEVSQKIEVVPYDYDRLQVDQVAAYKPYFSSSEFNHVHMLKAKRGDWWVMRGINNAHDDDSFMTRENFVGLVVVK